MPEVVDRLIGSGFKVPKDIDKLGNITKSALFMYSESQHYNENFNTMQFWVDNGYKTALERELVPVELLDDIQLKID